MTKKERARKWVHGYTAVGTGIVIAAIIPGSTSLALCTLEVTMCYHIGKIYRGENYSWGDANIAAGVIGVAAVAAKVAVLEALNFVPFAGWAIKAPVAAGVIKMLGEAAIAYYESLEPSGLEGLQKF